jgi:Ser/Thr protein kinase RdoA (MazF antagonist)
MTGTVSTTSGHSEPAEPYAGLGHDTVLDALESLGLACDGRVLALNSYENRVYRVGLEDAAAVVVKVYRPGRWSDAAIAEEHAFTAELAADGLSVLAPVVIGGHTLHHFGGFRLAVFPLRGGRAPELGRRETLRRLGQAIARIHNIGASGRFSHRIALDVDSYGYNALDTLLDGGWVPPELSDNLERLGERLLDLVEDCWEAVAPDTLRLHGDCHPGNILWREPPGQPGEAHFVDLDDALTGPAIQDLWMLMPPDPKAPERDWLLEGYETFRRLEPGELALVEPLRTLRMLHFNAWIARRWSDPAFPAAFAWFDSPRHFEGLIGQLQEQLSLMQEA